MKAIFKDAPSEALVTAQVRTASACTICRPVFTCYPEISSHTTKKDLLELVAFNKCRGTSFRRCVCVGARECGSYMRSNRLLWTVRLKMAPVMFPKSAWHFKASGYLPQRAEWKHFVFLLCIFLRSKLGHYLLRFLGEITATSFSCETPAVFCEIKNFTRPSTGMRVSR